MHIKFFEMIQKENNMTNKIYLMKQMKTSQDILILLDKDYQIFIKKRIEEWKMYYLFF